MDETPLRSSDEPDYEIGRPPAPEPPARLRRSPVLWVLAVLLVVVGAAAWFMTGRQTPAPGATTAGEAAPAEPAAPPPAPLGAAAMPVEVPPLDQTDALVRDLVGRLSRHPQVAAWLATDGLIRNFTVALSNVADGTTPARHLQALKPATSFSVTPRGEQLVVDPASYHRYDGLAAAARSLDPDGAAQIYTTLKPRIEQAYRELGHPDTPVDRAVERAIVRLLDTPAVDEPIVVRRATQGIGYALADPDLEALSPAQKQLLRMGPENLRATQAAIRAVALALGIPAQRLPSPRTVRQRR